MTSVEKRRSGRKSGSHRKHSDGGYSDTSSSGSFLDETDREVSNLTDRAFRSLCIGDEAVYNDSDLCSSSPCSQRDKQLAFGQNREDREREELKRAAHESFRLRVQQYEQDWVHGGMSGAEICRDPHWEIHGEMTQGRVSATFQHSFVESAQQEQSLREDQLSFLSNGATELSSQQRRSRSRVSSLIRTFNSDSQSDGAWTDGKLRERYNGNSWDKTALMSIQRELSEFSNSYQQNFTQDNFPTADPFSSRNANLYSAQVAAVAHVNSAPSFTGTSHSMFNCNSNFFIHSEFSPFRVWRDHNRFPFQQEQFSGFSHHSEIPKWYETPMYKELSQEVQPQGSYRFKERGIGYSRNNLLPGVPPSPPRSSSTVLQKALAVEKRCESELMGQYTHRKRIQSLGTKRLPTQRPSTASPTSEMSRRVQETISSVKALQQKIKKMTEQNMATGMTANQQGALCSEEDLISYGHNAVTLPNVVRSNTTPLNISQLLTPSGQTHQEASVVQQCAASPEPVEHPPVRAESRGATPDIRMSGYRSRATSLLFNLKDNRKRVKNTYSPTKFKNAEMLEKNKQPSAQQPRDTVIDIPDFPDTDIQFTHAASHQYVQQYQNPGLSFATQNPCPTSAHAGQYSEYSLSDYQTAEKQAEMVCHSTFTGFTPDNYTATQLANGQNPHEDFQSLSSYQYGMTDNVESLRGGVCGLNASYTATDTPKHTVNNQTGDYFRSNANAEQYFNETVEREFTKVERYQQPKDNKHDYSNVFSQERWRNEQDTEKLISPWKQEKTAFIERDQHSQAYQRAAIIKEEHNLSRDKYRGKNPNINTEVDKLDFEQSFVMGTSHKSTGSINPSVSKQLPQCPPIISNDAVENKTYYGQQQQPGTIRDKHVLQTYYGNNDKKETKDNSLTQNYNRHTDQDYRNQHAFYSNKDKTMFVQETGQRKQYLPVPEGHRMQCLQQIQATPQFEHNVQKNPLSSLENAAATSMAAPVKDKQFSEVKAEQATTEHMKAQHTQAELAKAQHQAQVEQPKAESARLILAGQTGSEEVKAEQDRAEPSECERVRLRQAEPFKDKQRNEEQTEQSKEKHLEQARKEDTKVKQTRVQKGIEKPSDITEEAGGAHMKNEQGEQVNAEQAEVDMLKEEHIKTELEETEQARIRTVHSKREKINVEKVEEKQLKVEQIEIEQKNAKQIRTEQIKAEQVEKEQRKDDKAKHEQIKEQKAKTEQLNMREAEVERVKVDQIKIEDIQAKPKEDSNQAGRLNTEQPTTQLRTTKEAKTEAQTHVEVAKPELPKTEDLYEKALSQKERAQTKQEILTSKIKAHAEKEISAIREKGLRDGLLSKNSSKQLAGSQSINIRQRPLIQEVSKKHESTVSSNNKPKHQIEPPGIQLETVKSVSPASSAATPVMSAVTTGQLVDSSQKQVPKEPVKSNDNVLVSSRTTKQTGSSTTITNLAENQEKKNQSGVNSPLKSKEHAINDHQAKQESNHEANAGKQKEERLKDDSVTSSDHRNEKKNDLSDATALVKVTPTKNPEIKHEAVPEDSAPTLNLVLQDQNTTPMVDDNLQIMGIMVIVRERKPLETNGERDNSARESMNTKKKEGSSGQASKENESSTEGNTAKTNNRVVQEMCPTEKEDQTKMNPPEIVPQTLSERKNNESERVTEKKENLQESSSINTTYQRETQLQKPTTEKSVPATVTAPAKNKVLSETQPLPSKQRMIESSMNDPSNKMPKENSAKNTMKAEEEINSRKTQVAHTHDTFIAKMDNTGTDFKTNSGRTDAESSIKHDVQLSSTKDVMTCINPSKSWNIDGKSAPLLDEKTQDSTPPPHSLNENQNRCVTPKLQYKETFTEKKNQVDDVHIDSIAIRVVPSVTKEDKQDIAGKPCVTVVPSNVVKATELHEVAPPRHEERANTSNNDDRIKDLAPANSDRQVEDKLGVQHVLASVRKLSDSLKNSNTNGTQTGNGKPETVKERENLVVESKIKAMEGDYFQVQGAEETNDELHNSANGGETLDGVSKGGGLPGPLPNKTPVSNKPYKELQYEAFVLDPIIKKTLESSQIKGQDENMEKKNFATEDKLASKQTDTPTERQNSSEKMKNGKQQTVSQSSLSARESQSSRSSDQTRDNAISEKPGVKPKLKSSTIPEISAIADYARLKVIVSEEQESTIQEFPPKKEGFFPLIQSRHCRRPVFTLDQKEYPVKEKKMPNKPEMSAKVNKEPKALVFPITEKEHQRTGMFKLGDKEKQEKPETQGISDAGAKHTQCLKERMKSPTTLCKNQGREEQVARTDAQRQVDQSNPLSDNPDLQMIFSSAAVNRPRNTSATQHLMSPVNFNACEKHEQHKDDSRTPRKAEPLDDKWIKRREEREEKPSQEGLATQHDETTAKQSEKEEASLIEKEKRAEEILKKRIIEESRASQAEEERRSAQREEERRAKEREAIALRIKERREKQRDSDKRAEEDRKPKQMKENRAAPKEEEMSAKLREGERKVKETERTKTEEERRAKLRREEEQLKEKEKKRLKQQEERAVQEEQLRRAALEKQKLAVQEEQQRRAALEKQKLAVQEEQQRRSAEEERQRRAAQEEQQRRAAQEEQQRRAAQEEKQKRAAQEEKQKRAAREEQQQRAAQEDQRRRAAQEEQQRRAAQEEQQRRAAQEEQQQRAAQEEQQRKAGLERQQSTAQEQQRRALQEEHQRRVELEKQKMAAHEEQQRIAAQEEQQRRAAQEEQQRGVTHEEQQRRAAREEQRRRDAQEEQQRRAAQEEQQKRAEHEQQRRATQEEQQRGVTHEEQQRRTAREEQQRRNAQEEQQRRAAQEEQQKRAEHEQQRRATQEEQQRGVTHEEQQRRAAREEQQRSDAQQELQIIAAQEQQRRATLAVQRKKDALIEERKQIEQTEDKILAEILEERKRAQGGGDRKAVEKEKTAAKQNVDKQAKEERTVQLEDINAEGESKVAREWLTQREDEIKATVSEEDEKCATQRKTERATQMEEQRKAAQMMDALQYYAINSTESERKTKERQVCSPFPSQQKHNPPECDSTEDSGTYTRHYRPHGSASPAPRSNTSSPALGAKPSMFRVKDNTIRGSSFTKPVKPRFHKNFGDDFRVGSPIERVAERGEEEQEIIRHGADTRSNRLAVIKEFSTSQPASSSQDYSAHQPQHRPYSRRSIALDEDDSRSIISNMSEGVESFATSATDLADVRSLYDYDRPESACSYSSDMSRSMGKPPTVPPKSDKAMQRAKRLTTRRINKELCKTKEDKHAGGEKPPQEVCRVPPSSSNEVHYSNRHAVASPHFSSPISLAHAPVNMPTSHTEHPSSHHPVQASPNAAGASSLPIASPHVTASVTLPVASSNPTSPASHNAVLKTVPHVSSSPTLHHATHPAPVTQYHVESSYPQSYPFTQRKVLQDLGSGQYFVVDVPVQVKTKTFFDPETGKYVQLNVRESGQSTSRPQPQQTYQQPQLQPQMRVKSQHPNSQASPAGKPIMMYQGYHGYPQGYQPTAINSVPPNGSSTPLSLHQNQQPVRENHSYGYPTSEVQENSEGHRYSPEKTPYMDTVNDTEKTYNTLYNTHGSYEAFPECDTNSQLAGSSVCENDNSAHTRYQPRDIITMGELEDFMEVSDW
ncbi:uncharacterized protein LOC131474343 [Solea solea]|uniref:uncharacterized protein LOC131474343 n=1 Tax=Solea solea TaxID=90069 RepID=UPI00272C5687|nr:uncharacterized protein LOC131474343 [Solea solea]